MLWFVLLLVFDVPTVVWAGQRAATMSLREQLIAAEDTRAQSDADLALLRQNLTHRDLQIRLQAVRAMGRLERPELIAALTRPLADSHPLVRLEAANAIGQSAKGPKGVADAKSRLVARARVEQEPRVWGVIAATLGRLPYTAGTDVDEAEAVMARVLPAATATAIQIEAVLGAVEGLEALARQSGKLSKLKASTIAGLRAAAALEGRAADRDALARIRRLATQALVAAGGATRPLLDRTLSDPDEEVRRLTMIAVRAVDDGEALVRKALADASPRVRFEALQTWGRMHQKTACDPVIAALDDPSPHVALLAIDLLGSGCGGLDASAPLNAIATRSLDGPRSWHRPAHALVSLSRVSPTVARSHLARFAAHSTWQLRMYAARAAAGVSDIDTLVALGRDPHHNVREAAIGGLVQLKRPEAAALALDALTASDYQLVMTAARALGGSADRTRAVTALQQAHARITAERRDTARDPLNALRDALKNLGAEVPPPPAPQPIVRPAITEGQLAALATTRLRVIMAGLGAFELRLLPSEAVVTAAHVAALARQGHYNSLTFHRVAPNFVIQGGSPGANEYMGQGPYMRDEVGLRPHARGTVGISTRARDTGDAQIFINLVDSPRLDHNYTVFAEVTAGMDVVDAVLEGDVIERIEVLEASPTRDDAR